MKDWKTTLGGLVLGIPFLTDSLITAYIDGEFEQKNTLQIALSITAILIGLILKDPKRSAKKDIVGGRPDDRK